MRIPETAEMLRRSFTGANLAVPCAQLLPSLVSRLPLGWDSDPPRAMFSGWRTSEVALDGIRLRKWGQHAIEIWAASASIRPGSFRRRCSDAHRGKRDEILKGFRMHWPSPRARLTFFKHMMEKLATKCSTFANFPSLFYGIRPQGRQPLPLRLAPPP